MGILFENKLYMISIRFREGLPKRLSVDEAKSLIAKRDGVSIDSIVDTAETLDDVLRRSVLMLKQVATKLASNDQSGSESVSSSSSSGGASEFGDGAKALIVSHHVLIKTFLVHFCGFSQLANIKLDNGSLTVVHVDVNDSEKDLYAFQLHDTFCNYRTPADSADM